MNRILHVVYQMDRGGAETWLMHVFRHIDRSRFQFDFLVHARKQCAYDEEILKLGGRIFRAPHPSQFWTYDRYVRRLLRDQGPFAAVHSHTCYFDGHVLRMAAREGVPLRIVHSHNSLYPRLPGLARKIYLYVTTPWIERYATCGLACSAAAACALFGADWTRDPRWKVLFYGLDFSAFSAPSNRADVRAELRIPENALVVGHVGRFYEQKNHVFLIDVARELVGRRPQTHFLLVGDGPLKARIENQVAQAGLQRHVTFAGVRADVPRLMLSAMDVFLFPSLYEGTPLVLMEAQAAGLPCVFSDVITPEADVVSSLVKRVSLSEPPASWAKTVEELLAAPPAVAKAEALATAVQSQFNLFSSIRRLECLYASIPPQPDLRSSRI